MHSNDLVQYHITLHITKAQHVKIALIISCGPGVVAGRINKR
jgi:hypothetical protein